jgi:WD40 repeat protein
LTENSQSELQELQLIWQGHLHDLVTSIAYSPDGRGWVASSAAGEIIWNSGLSELVILSEPTGQSIDHIAFSADHRWLAAAGQAGELLVWNCDDINLPPQLVTRTKFDQWIEHLVWHPINPHLAISYGSQTTIWNPITAESIATWKFGKSSVFDLAWHPIDSYLAIAGYKGVEIWSLLNDDASAPIDHLAVETASLKIAWSDDGHYLVAGNLDQTLNILDWHDRSNQWTLQGCEGKIRQLVWITDATNSLACLAVASGTSIVLWRLIHNSDTWTGELLEGHQGIVEILVVPNHLSILTSGGADGYLCLWSPAGEIVQILTTPIIARFTSLCWHPRHLQLVAGNEAGVIALWRIPA